MAKDIFQEFVEDIEYVENELDKPFYTADELATEIRKVVFAIFHNDRKKRKRSFHLMLDEDVIRIFDLHSKKHGVSAHVFASKYLKQRIMEDLKKNGMLEVK